MMDAQTTEIVIRTLNFILALAALVATASAMRILSGRLNTACKIFLTAVAILTLRTGLAIVNVLSNESWKISVGVTDTILLMLLLTFIIYLDGTFMVLARVKQDKGR